MQKIVYTLWREGVHYFAEGCTLFYCDKEESEFDEKRCAVPRNEFRLGQLG